MPEDDSTVEERLAVRLVREFECVADVEPLVAGSVPTPDWRLTLADGRVADMEVTWATNESARRFKSQLADEQVDETGLRRRRCRKEWPDARLSMVWDVRVHDHAPGSNKRPAKELVKALMAVLIEVEAAGGTPEDMARAARDRLVDPQAHFSNHEWPSERLARLKSDAEFDEAMLQWGQDTGYWYPQLLLDHFNSLRRGVHWLKASTPEVSGCEMVRTSPTTPGAVVGEYEHMLSTVQKCINAKTAKRQMENAPSLRWLFCGA